MTRAEIEKVHEKMTTQMRKLLAWMEVPELAELPHQLLAVMEALENIEGMGFDAPATFEGSDLDWAKLRASLMQSIARAALQEQRDE